MAAKNKVTAGASPVVTYKGLAREITTTGIRRSSPEHHLELPHW